VKGSQPFHQLIPMATRSSARHKLIWFSPQLVEVVLQNLLGIWPLPVLVLLHSRRSGSLDSSVGNTIMPMHIDQHHHYVDS
jgi:hypothetical protein